MSVPNGQGSLQRAPSVKIWYRFNGPREVRSFLGMVGFSARFIPSFSTMAEPLREISRQGVPFVWGSEQEQAFQELKQQLASVPVLAYFDKDAHTRVIAEASPVGLGAVLVEEKMHCHV